jgi:hypothetical protein
MGMNTCVPIAAPASTAADSPEHVPLPSVSTYQETLSRSTYRMGVAYDLRPGTDYRRMLRKKPVLTYSALTRPSISPGP